MKSRAASLFLLPFGITKRSRILYYNPNFLSKKEIEDISYEDLSDKKWLNSIAVRQSNNIYNQSLVASMLEHNGVSNTKKWLEGLVNNFARSPQGNDRAQILMVASGEAKLAIANSYYYALMLSGRSLVFSHFETNGTKINKWKKYQKVATLPIMSIVPSAGLAPTQPRTRQSARKIQNNCL